MRSAGALLVAMLVAFAAGCRDGSSDRAADYRKELSSSGDRVVLNEPDDDGALGKVRVRSNRHKIYDDQMSPVGTVAWTDAGDREGTNSDEDTGQGQPSVRIQKLGAEAEQTLPIDQTAQKVEIDGRFRIEHTDEGWAVFDEAAELIGIVERDGDRWQLRHGYGEAPHVVKRGDEGVRILRAGEEVATTPADDLSDLVLLAWTIDTLDPLDRAAVGVWLDRRERDH